MAARAGTLEWIAVQRPDDLAVLDIATGRRLTRAEHDASATRLAHALRHAGVGPGDRVLCALGPGADELLLAFACAKLGAAPVHLPSGVAVAAAGRELGACVTLGPSATGLGDLLAGAGDLDEDDEPHLRSGLHDPPDAVLYDLGDPPRAVVRVSDPARLPEVAVTLGDLLARIDLRAGDVHLMGTGLDHPGAGLPAHVTLISGGTVLAGAPDLARLLGAVAGHAATSAFLPAPALAALLELDPDAVQDADLTTLRSLITGWGPVDSGALAAAADLLGEETVHVVAGTAATGEVAVDGRVLDGVAAKTGADGTLTVRTPLAPSREPIATGLRL